MSLLRPGGGPDPSDLSSSPPSREMAKRLPNYRGKRCRTSARLSSKDSPALGAAAGAAATSPPPDLQVLDARMRRGLEMMSFLLQDVFGEAAEADEAPLPPTDREGLLPHIPIFVSDECMVCFEEAPALVAYPCGHMCVCCDCVVELTERRCSCPLCRAHVSGYVLRQDVRPSTESDLACRP